MGSPERAPPRRREPGRWREPNRPPTPTPAPRCLRCFSFSPAPQAAERQAATSQVHSGGATGAAIAHGLDPDGLDSRRGWGRGRIHRPKKRRRQEPGSRARDAYSARTRVAVGRAGSSWEWGTRRAVGWL